MTREERTLALERAGVLNLHVEAVRDASFAGEDLFFDPRDLVQVKYEMLRRSHLQGRTQIVRTARDFGFSRTEFYRIDQKFQAEGVPGLLPRKRGPLGAHKLSWEIYQFLLERLAAEPDLSLEALAAQVRERFGVGLHPRTLHRALEDRWEDP